MGNRRVSLGFAIRTWFTRRQMQRHNWRPSQTSVGPLGISRNTHAQIKKLKWPGFALLLFFGIYTARSLPHANVFTVFHIWMVDVGMIDVSEITCLQQIGQSSESRSRDFESGFMNYNQAAEKDRALVSRKFDPVSPAVLSQHKLQHRQVKAPSLNSTTDNDI